MTKSVSQLLRMPLRSSRACERDCTEECNPHQHREHCRTRCKQLCRDERTKADLTKKLVQRAVHVHGDRVHRAADEMEHTAHPSLRRAAKEWRKLRHSAHHAFNVSQSGRTADSDQEEVPFDPPDRCSAETRAALRASSGNEIPFGQSSPHAVAPHRQAGRRVRMTHLSPCTVG